MQKLINEPAHVVTEYLQGLAAAHPEYLRFDAEQRIVVRTAPAMPGKVNVAWNVAMTARTRMRLSMSAKSANTPVMV